MPAEYCVRIDRAGALTQVEDDLSPGNSLTRVRKDPELDGREAHARLLEHKEGGRASAEV